MRGVSVEIVANTLDDLLDTLYRNLLDAPLRRATRGSNREIIGVQFVLRDPRARISRSGDRGKLFSALGELLWYLTRGDELDFIRRYIDAYKDESEDGVTVHGAYGLRLFAMRGIDQVANVMELLRRHPDSRRAVVQLFNAEDANRPHREIPCTTSLQFLVRDRRLELIATLRSNDAYMGLPHDVFCFTMLQEMVARALGREPGPYRQFVGSMHLYVKHETGAQAYLDEGLHRPVAMPAMPIGDPFVRAVPALLDAERRIRSGEWLDAGVAVDDPYWADLVRLLQAFAMTGMPARLQGLALELSNPLYRPYVDARRDMRPRRPDQPTQLKLEI